MSKSQSVKNQLGQIYTIEDLTQAFEGIASIHISHIRDRVVASKQFFNELWPIYRSLRVDPKTRLKRTHTKRKGAKVFVVVTDEGRLGTETTEKIVDSLVAALGKSQKTDVIAVGSRGAQVLQQKHGIAPTKTFPMPQGDSTVNAGDIIKQLDSYETISVFYQTYESLRTQSVVRIDLISAIHELGDQLGEGGEEISSADYIFEPNINEIADYMESVMLGVAFIQIIMESKLAGYAARFNAMSRAKKRAGDLAADFKRRYYQMKRAESDERLKEMSKAAKIQKLQRSQA